MSLLVLLSRQGAAATTVALIGQGFAYAQGSPPVRISCAPTGQTTSVVQGALAGKVVLGVVGQTYAAAQGSFSLSTKLTPTGQSFGFSQGVLGRVQSTLFVGQSYEYTNGFIATKINALLFGQAIPFSIGALSGSPPPFLTKTCISVFTQDQVTNIATRLPRVSTYSATNSAVIETVPLCLDVHTLDEGLGTLFIFQKTKRVDVWIK